jgi:hypothetical protein
MSSVEAIPRSYARLTRRERKHLLDFHADLLRQKLYARNSENLEVAEVMQIISRLQELLQGYVE